MTPSTTTIHPLPSCPTAMLTSSNLRFGHARLLSRALPAAVLPALALLAITDANAAPVIQNNVDETEPSIAYSPEDDEFLAVWSSYDTFGAGNIYGRRYDGAGAVIGGVFTIAGDLTDDEYSPVVEYDPVSKGFLVAYVHDDGTDSDIRIAGVAQTGVIVLQPLNVAVASDGKRETTPKLAFSAGTGNFVVSYVLEYSATDHDVHAVRFDPASGTVVGLRLDVAVSGANELESDIACATTGSTCMIASRKDPGPAGGNKSIEVRGINASAWTRFASSNSLTTATTSDHVNPAIAADDSGNYLVVWEHEYSANDTDIWAERILPTGLSTGGFISVGVGPQFEQRPDVAYIDTFDEYYVTWQDQGPSAPFGSPFDIWSRAITASHGTLRPGKRVSSSVNSKDDLAPAVALSGDFPDVGMVVWEHIYSAAAPFVVGDTDIHFQLIEQSGA